MTTQSEYLKALEWVDSSPYLRTYVANMAWGGIDHVEAIRRALRIAHRLTQEPSEGMVEKAKQRAMREEFCLYTGVFKAMAAELLKEESENG